MVTLVLLRAYCVDGATGQRAQLVVELENKQDSDWWFSLPNLGGLPGAQKICPAREGRVKKPLTIKNEADIFDTVTIVECEATWHFLG